MIEGSCSSTAIVVAGGVVLAAEDATLRGCVLPDAAPLSRALLRTTAAGRVILKMVGSRIGRSALRLLERLTIPGIVGHWNCRKCWIDDAWKQARGDGYDTILVLGSGFDTLSLRVARSHGDRVRVIDVDHPATLAARRAGVSDLGGRAPIMIEHDLGTPGVCRALGTHIGEDTSVFVVIEGVLMYFDAARVESLLAEVASIPARRLRVAFTYMEESPEGVAAFRPHSLLVHAWLSIIGEPFRSCMKPESIAALLGAHGFVLRDMSSRPGHSLVERALAGGEGAVVAERVRGTP